MSRNTIKILWSFCFVSFVILLLLYEAFREDEVINTVTSNLSSNDRYVVLSQRIEPEFKVKNGQLGKFSECIKKYKGLSHRKVSNPDGKREYLTLELTTGVRLNFGVSDGEAYDFYVEIGNKDIESKLYAVNCNLELLDQKYD